MQKEEHFRKRIQDLARMAYERDIVTFTDFLDLNEQHIVNSLTRELAGVTHAGFGGYDMSERQITAFIPDALSYEWEYPICCLHIRPRDGRFAETLTHRDYLGALLNLGIDRSMLGDLLIDESSAYLYCVDHMSQFIIQELTRVRRTAVTVVQSETMEPAVTRNFREIKGTVASVRLDALIALAFQSSRNRMVPLIEGGKVFVNGRMVTSNGCALREGDVISVREHGKFRFAGVISETKKGRCLVSVSRYS